MRRVLLNVHLYIAALVAPVFIMLAISGGLYLLDIKGKVTQTDITLPAGATLDFESADLEADVTALLAAQGIAHRFEYVVASRTRLQTRPSSRTSYQFEFEGDTLKATRLDPDIQKIMIELHKGHGPRLFKTYQKLVAIALILSVLSGVWMGLASKVFRKRTALAGAAGLAVFVLIGFVV